MEYRVWIVLAICLFLAAIGTAAFAAPPDNRPPDNRPPDGRDTHSPVDISNTVDVSGSPSAEASAVVGDVTLEPLQNTWNKQQNSQTTGDTTVTVETRHPDDIRIKNVPSLRAPYMNATAPCRIALSAGVTLVGGGVSGGASVEDKECTRRQSAQTWASVGVPGMAIWLMCRSLDMERAGATPEDCEAMAAQFQIEAELAEDTPVVYEPTPDPALQARVGALEARLAESNARAREAEKNAQRAAQAAREQRSVVVRHTDDYDALVQRLEAVKESDSFKRLYDDG